jgi:CHAT domain-containing protein
MVVALVAITAMAGALCPRSTRRFLEQYRLRRRVAAVVTAADALPHRSIEARLAGGFAHRPLQPATRSGEGRAAEDGSWRLRSAIAALQEGRKPLQAGAALLVGDEKRAVPALETLLGRRNSEEPVADAIQRSTDADLLVNLTAAYHTRWRTTGRGADAMLAAATAARAHTLAPRSPAAAWNLALAYESIGLAPEARQAWREYLGIDADPAWNDEARQHIAALDWEGEATKWTARAAELEAAAGTGDAAAIESIAQHFAVRTKAQVEQQWIARWAAAASSGSHDADPLLRAIEAAGRGVFASSRDRQLIDFVDAVHASPDLRRFARAHLDLLEAQKALRENGTREAITVLERATRELRTVGSPVAATVAVELGGHFYHAGDHVRALRELAAAEPLVPDRWPLLAARLWWNRGVALTSLGHLDDAAAAYERTLDLYRLASDDTHSGFLHMLDAHNAETAHDLDRAWAGYLDGLRLAERYGTPERTIGVLDAFCRAALRVDQYRFAAILNDALLARAHDPAYAPYRCHALITRCEIAARSGDHAAAAIECGRARQEWSSIVDEAVRDRLSADLDLATAAASPPSGRIAALTRAVDLTVRRKDLYRLSQVLLLRGQAYVAAGAAASARTDFEEGLKAIEEQRARLDTVPDRLTYFDTSRATARELVRLFVRSGDTDQAFRVVERVRARSLLDHLGVTAPVVSATDLRSALGPHHAIVEYWADERELFAWIIRAEGMTFVRTGAMRPAVAEAARQLSGGLRSSDSLTADAAAAGSFLHGALIAPIASALHGVDTVTIVPDEAIAGVPFAALRDGATGRYVLEQYAVTQAPSASAFRAANPAIDSLDSILVMAAPKTAEPLPPLDVRAEIEAARRATKRTVVYEGLDAKESVIRRNAGTFAVLHVAAHGVSDPSSGEPALAFTAESAGDDGLLKASEVESEVAVRKGALVVLAACGTGRGRTSIEGTSSMARAFLAAGAGSVVASLWDVDDGDSGRLFAAFYSAIAGGSRPQAALRSAQLSLLRNPAQADPHHWAAYQFYGGRANAD